MCGNSPKLFRGVLNPFQALKNIRCEGWIKTDIRLESGNVVMMTSFAETENYEAKLTYSQNSGGEAASLASGWRGKAPFTALDLQ